MISILLKRYKTIMALLWKIKYQGEIFVEKKGVGSACLSNVHARKKKKSKS